MQESKLSALIERFNDRQKEAVNNISGPELIVAGAGSGKTSVLTARIALLIEQGVMPERILALTFTKKAAEEMRNRIIALVGQNARRVRMGTFHSVFVSLLRPHASLLGFPNNFTISDEEDSLKCLKRCINEVLDVENRPSEEEMTQEQRDAYAEIDSRYNPKYCKSVISRCKNDLITPDMYAADTGQIERDDTSKRPLMFRIFKKYCDKCHQSGVMDFDDILLYMDMLMHNFPDVAKHIADSFEHILVDEYQDTNWAQYSILMRLTKENKNICVVGDDSQSIYGFRGARIKNILSFKTDFEDCRIVKLEQNYRSTRQIVNSANNLIAYNKGRIPKTCFSTGQEGDPIALEILPSGNQEAVFVVDAIKMIKRECGLQWKDFAILYRTNSQSRLFEEHLVKKNIPYMVYSGTSFYDRMEIKDQMAYMKLAVNPSDDESFLRVVNKPARGIGNATVEQIIAYAQDYGLSLWDAINHPFFSVKGAKASAGIEKFRKTISNCIEAAGTLKAHDAATRICDESQMYDSYMKTDTPESLDRANNIRELMDAVKIYETDTVRLNASLRDEDRADESLPGFLQNAMLLSNADTTDGDNDKVNLMTVHCSKGLEFDTVFVTGMEQGLFPLTNDILGDQEEERRLFYVAITRAMNRVVLTLAEKRMRFGKTKETQVSSFIRELQEEKN